MYSSWQHKFPDGQPYCWPMLTPPLTPSPSHSAASSGVNTPQPESSASLSSNPNYHFHVFNVVSHDINESPHQAGASVPDPNPPILTDFAPQAEHVQQQHPQRQQSGSSGQKPVSPINEPILERRGSEEDDNLAYARSRRKDQNRAAQRAFRERKEKYVKALEAKIAQLEVAQRQTSCENERLEKILHKMFLENASLRIAPHVSRSSLPTESARLMHFNSKDLFSEVVRSHTNKSPFCQIRTSIDGESLLAADAAWDLIIGHKLFKKGLIDIGDVTDLLKHWRQGPVFSKRAIISAIEKSARRRTDDLIWTVGAINEG
ncbi:hypothetical protein HZS61_011076 [Fusarium oxysporum f. sp. conglutinans]|uniref:BZIP domain-containing protein n=3 Tax=Fusarium oxysporum f. sp. conglutinans TaxID=100902 RepID=A0A8H6GXM8_FUSOX|nr:hypothetical protein FOXB_11926 [Fusarium oxysporum f. sp. conglutinans Fo5176]KAF6525281.1 hypothetical protein HZS61_011076 [Fusarium oxysporum f. sp. conglutinans]KAG6996958.1 AP-1-like transcription factor napA [Fusarium oxysporum f. sp. conglutinans]KAI8411698.1 hypothetical protein FOFC_08292 [Fusarium oxysporum]